MLVYRAVKGSPLTIAEFDGNFHDVDDRITTIEDNPAEARSIDEITAVGNTLVILYTDSTEDTVTLPAVSLRGRGDWLPSTAYLVNDTVQANGVVYVVPTSHTSALTFDPGANDGNGHDFYSPLFDIPELTLPVGGADGYVLTQVGSDLENQWTNAGIPTGGDAGQVLTKLSDDDRDTDWRSPRTLVPASSTISDIVFTPDIDDANGFFRCINVAGCAVSIVAGVFDLDTELIFRQCNTGPISLLGDVTFDGIDGFAIATDTRGAILHCKLVEIDSNLDETWDVWGLLAPESV
jgi:hypothetical protein